MKKHAKRRINNTPRLNSIKVLNIESVSRVFSKFGDDSSDFFANMLNNELKDYRKLQTYQDPELNGLTRADFIKDIMPINRNGLYLDGVNRRSWFEFNSEVFYFDYEHFLFKLRNLGAAELTKEESESILAISRTKFCTKEQRELADSINFNNRIKRTTDDISISLLRRKANNHN